MVKMLALTEESRVVVVDGSGVVRGSTAGVVLTFDDVLALHEMRGFGAGPWSLWLMPEWPGMSDAEIYHLPESVAALEAYGATLERTIAPPEAEAAP